MDALELLRSDHDTVRQLFRDFEEAEEAQDTTRMGELAQTIFTELETHTSIEEEIFYPEAEKAGPEVEELVKEGVEEHHVVDVLIDELQALQPGKDNFAPKMTVLIENVEHHAKEEEDELFPKLREAFGDQQLQRIGEALEQAKQRHEQAGKTKGKTKKELYDQARQQGISGRSSMTKEELAEAVEPG
jgi:hemerythrin superfamily protein